MLCSKSGSLMKPSASAQGCEADARLFGLLEAVASARARRAVEGIQMHAPAGERGPLLSFHTLEFEGADPGRLCDAPVAFHSDPDMNPLSHVGRRSGRS